jgi:predicted lactoylglutathione lyase
MRFMVMVKGNEETEAGVMPSTEMLAAMGNYNEQLVKAGIMKGGEGLQPTSKGARVRFSGNKRTVVDGPFAETKELVAGFWLWETRSLAEAIEWVKMCPNPTGEQSEIEIRQIFEAEDFGESFTPELREQDDRLRAETESKQSAKSKMIFVNLPVRDLGASTKFYTALGGELNPQFSDDNAKSVMLSDVIGVMLLTHDHYRNFTKRPIGDARRESQTLLALSVDSRDAVDATVKRAAAAGGRADPNPIQDLGFMFSRSVEDPDGNVWEIIWMDPSAHAKSLENA